MLSIKNMSFKGKMLLYAASTTGTALALCCVAVVTVEWIDLQEEIPRSLSIQTDVLGKNATAALTFDDRASAKEMLAGLRADKNVILACICARDGTEFAKYVRAGSEGATLKTVGPSGYRFSVNRFHIRRPIVLEGEQLGSIYLQYDLQELYARLWRTVGFVSLGTLVALVGAGLVSTRLQRVLTRPVTELALTARTVAKNKDYSVRAVKHSSDELGTLTDAFNDMLSRIQRRDTELQESHDTLEQRVRDRTATIAQRERQQAAVAELGRHALATADLASLLDVAVEQISRTLNVEFVKVLELLPDQNAMLLRAGVGWKGGSIGHATVGVDLSSQAGYTLVSDRPVVVDHLPTETRFSGPPFLHDHHVISGMSVIIAGKDRPFGVLGAHTTHRRKFTRDDVYFLQAVGNLLAEASQRWWTEEELRKLSVAVEQSPTTVVITNTEGVIEYVNPRFTETTGYSAEEAIGRYPRILKSDETPPETYEDLWKTIIGGKVWRGELRNRRKSGEIFWETASISPIRNTQGVITHFLAVKEDITERKKAEGELRQAKIAAEAANKAKSEFLANMSHEIRTPMTAILGFADVLLEHGDLEDAPPERVEAAETIKRNGEHLIAIINDILDLSKIEAGKMTVEQATCSPCKIVEEVLSLLRVRTDTKGLALDVRYFGPVPETIQSAPIRLRQILINLIGNAIKFTEFGAVHLEIRCVRDADEPLLQFDVVDTGLGMTAEQAATLFQPFVQADTSMTRAFGGTGLGLTISKRFAQMLGGDVVLVETRKGVGTRFRLRVVTGPLEGVRMLDNPSGAVTPERALPGTVAKTAQDALDGFRILLAEDGPDNQRLIAHVLRKVGAEVTVEDNGKLAAHAALAALAAGKPFDVILMDMQMPVMDGYEATAMLRREGYAGTIIALTAHAMAGDREKCLKSGCDEYATKPIDRAELIATIHEQLTTADIKT